MNNNPDNVWILNVITACPLLVPIFASFVLLKSAEPPTPPSGSAEKLLSEKPLSLKELGKIMLQILKNRTVLVMITCGGMGGGMLQTLLTQLNQLMCSRNYPIEQSSFACIINIAVGILTVWKSKHLFATQILREINVGDVKTTDLKTLVVRL